MRRVASLLAATATAPPGATAGASGIATRFLRQAGAAREGSTKASHTLPEDTLRTPPYCDPRAPLRAAGRSLANCCKKLVKTNEQPAPT